MNDIDDEGFRPHYPFADGRNMAWLLEGFGTDDRLQDEQQLSREQYLGVRHLFEDVLGDDAWMGAGAWPVPDGLRQPLQDALGGEVRLRSDLDYFLGGYQDFPDGGSWRPRPGDLPAPGPIPAPRLLGGPTTEFAGP